MNPLFGFPISYISYPVLPSVGPNIPLIPLFPPLPHGATLIEPVMNFSTSSTLETSYVQQFPAMFQYYLRLKRIELIAQQLALQTQTQVIPLMSHAEMFPPTTEVVEPFPSLSTGSPQSIFTNLPEIQDCQIVKINNGTPYKRSFRPKIDRTKSEIILLCSTCEKTFKNSNSLQTHIGRMHSEKKFKCESTKCEKKYAYKSDLLVHDKTCKMLKRMIDQESKNSDSKRI